MENFLRLRELGASRELLIAQTTRVYHDLHQLDEFKIQNDNTSAVNALECDNTNARYLLRAGANSTVNLYDLESNDTLIRSKQEIPQ